MKKLIACSLAVLAFPGLYANYGDSLATAPDQAYKDSIDKTLQYEAGQISLGNGAVQLHVPAGFKFLNAVQSQFVLTRLWNNRPSKDILGMVFPEGGGPHAENSYAFVVSYKDIGYVNDEEAENFDYDELLNDMQKEEVEDNEVRKKNGYPTVHTVGWAQKPFYDRNNKVIHWAMELKFGSEEENTLNYDVRILGRKGILSLFGVADMSELELVKKDIGKLLHMASFTEGNKYINFDNNVDKVAAVSIGGLVAGKALGSGFMPFIMKFGKFILIGIVALGGILFKFIKCKKPQEGMA